MVTVRVVLMRGMAYSSYCKAAPGDQAFHDVFEMDHAQQVISPNRATGSIR